MERNLSMQLLGTIPIEWSNFPCARKKAKTYLNISVASTAEVVVLVKRVRGALCKEGGGSGGDGGSGDGCISSRATLIQSWVRRAQKWNARDACIHAISAFVKIRGTPATRRLIMLLIV